MRFPYGSLAKVGLGVDLHFDWDYTAGIEVILLCEQISTKSFKLSWKARVCSRAFFIPILKGD